MMPPPAAIPNHAIHRALRPARTSAGALPDPAEGRRQLQAFFATLPPDRYPRTAALAAHLPALTTTEQCDHGIE